MCIAKKLKIKLIIVFIFSSLLVACSNKEAINYNQILQDFCDALELPEITNENLTLNDSFEYKGYIIYAKWLSSDEEIISNNGQVTQQDDFVEVTIRGTFSLDIFILEKDYIIGVTELTNEEIGNKILDTIIIPTTTSSNLHLPKFIAYNGTNYLISWASKKPDIISNSGIITKNEEDISVELICSLLYKNSKCTKAFNITVKAFDTTNMTEYLSSLDLEKEYENNIDLPFSYNDGVETYSISWSSSNTNIISNSGIVTQDLINHNVALTATISIDNISIDKTFNVIIKKADKNVVFDNIIHSIHIPSLIRSSIVLPITFNNGLKGNWISSNEEIVLNNGKLLYTSQAIKKITLTLNINIQGELMTHEFNSTITNQDHFFMLADFSTGIIDNLTINNNGNLEMLDNATIGTYISPNFESASFTDAVATWCATSSTKSTCELLVRFLVNSKWSNYITYGQWGQGINNKSSDQTKDLIKLNDDEIVVLNNQKATGFSFKVIFRRKSLTDSSPVLNRITLALNLADPQYHIDDSFLQQSIKYEVPALYQHDVPTIGNIICSATSSTMLLKYKGHNFSSIDNLEHRYIAKIVKDYGNDIYGNWAYNCAGMSSFGEIAYVKRYVDTNEFLFELQSIGPMAASIKGTVNYTSQLTNNHGSYTTSGHLIVVTGFEINTDNTYIFINDPNVKGVKIKMLLNDFLAVWRNVAYVIE